MAKEDKEATWKPGESSKDEEVGKDEMIVDLKVQYKIVTIQCARNKILKICHSKGHGKRISPG